MGSHDIHTQEAKHEQEVGPGDKASKSAPSDPLPSEAPPPKGFIIFPNRPNRDQLYKRMGLWGTFHIQTHYPPEDPATAQPRV